LSPPTEEKKTLLATRLQSALQSKFAQKLLESRPAIPEEPSIIESPHKQPPRDLKQIEKCLKAKVKRVIMEDLTEQSHLRRLKVIDKHLKIKARLEQRH
jgi:hypothetical protein